LNETLCHALLRTRLTEEDVAARLQVDPKTVRRWLERPRALPAAPLGHRRHARRRRNRPAGPQLRAARARPNEVVAVYPHRDTVPQDIWLRVLDSAQHDIGILDDMRLFPVGDQAIVAALAERAKSEMRVVLEERMASTSAQFARFTDCACC